MNSTEHTRRTAPSPGVTDESLSLLRAAAVEPSSCGFDGPSTRAVIAAADEVLRRFAAESHEPFSRDSAPASRTADLVEYQQAITKPDGTVLWGRFRLIRLLGKGGFGIVFQAFDTVLHRHVALKLPRPEHLCSRSHRSRFLHEARLAADLNHPGIVKIYEVGEQWPMWYIASALCSGPTLAQWLRDRSEPVPVRLAAELVRQLADTVDHAHRRAVLHLDLKPSNVLMESGDEQDQSGPRVLLTDFGLASREGESLEDGSRRRGTRPYMPPECFSEGGRAPGVARDVYALGARRRMARVSEG